MSLPCPRDPASHTIFGAEPPHVSGQCVSLSTLTCHPQASMLDLVFKCYLSLKVMDWRLCSIGHISVVKERMLYFFEGLDVNIL